MRFVRKTNKAMNWIFGVICLTATWVAVSSTFCSTEDDCREGYCCVALTMRQMRKRGLCLRLTRERKTCSEPESKMDYYGGKFHSYCPCSEGLVCAPNKPGITNPERRWNALRCQKLTATTAGPDVTTASEVVTDEEIVTNPPEIVTDDDIVEETLPPETDAPEEVVETEAPEEEVVEEETEAPEEEVVEEETEAPEEEVVEEETEAPEEEVVEEETEAPEEEVVEEETEAPEEEVVEEEETEAPEEEEVVEEAGQRGPGGERPREDDPDCEDWTYGC